MTPLHDFVARHGAVMTPHPATESAPGGVGLVVVTPTDTWHSVEDHRTDTTAAVLVAPGLHRGGFVPNVIAATSIISPAVPVPELLEAVAACMDVVDDWQVRARSVTGGSSINDHDHDHDHDDDNDDNKDQDDDDKDQDDDDNNVARTFTLDILGEYRVDQHKLALSSLVWACNVGGATVLFQTHVTTFADQIVEHAAGLEAAKVAAAV